MKQGHFAKTEEQCHRGPQESRRQRAEGGSLGGGSHSVDQASASPCPSNLAQQGPRGMNDTPFIVLTETKFSFRCIPVWDRYSPHRTRVEKKETEIFIKELENKFEQLIVNKKKSLEQKLDQMRVKAIKDIQNISNKIALEAVKKIILNSANDEKMKVVNQKNLDKIFVNLKDSKIS